MRCCFNFVSIMCLKIRDPQNSWSSDCTCWGVRGSTFSIPRKRVGRAAPALGEAHLGEGFMCIYIGDRSVWTIGTLHNLIHSQEKLNLFWLMKYYIICMAHISLFVWNIMIYIQIWYVYKQIYIYIYIIYLYTSLRESPETMLTHALGNNPSRGR